MYLDHFGLNEPPFKITPVTDFFFPGANRAEILDALLYTITDSEGIIKVTGEVGSGKTMLCRMLLERSPERIEAVYLANPSLSREEMLYAIADELNLDLEGQRVNVILQTLQNHLEMKLAQGKRIVILVDEAHAMPLETMEELRLLYNLQVGNNKLLHIVLFGQPELNDKLSQPNMRQLKDRIVHHFSMLPLSQNIIESYLLFRMRTAGYRGPSPFSVPAAALIGKASQGLMRRVNILADKSMLAAFVENIHNIDVRHVQAAIRDTELDAGTQTWWQRKIPVTTGILTISATLIIAGIGWIIGSMLLGKPGVQETQYPPTSPPATPAIIPALAVTTRPPAPTPAPPGPALEAMTPPAAANNPAPASKAAEEPAVLLEQRIIASQALLASRLPGSASIQLYYTNDVRPARLEKFLQQADEAGNLHNIYVLPIKINWKQGLRVLYGNYANSDAARASVAQLPRRYLEAYAPSIFLLEDAPVTAVQPGIKK